MEEVQFLAARDAVFWFMVEKTNDDKIITLDPFSSSCVGISSDSSYTVQSDFFICDFLLLMQSFLGLMVFKNHKMVVNVKIVNCVARYGILFFFHPFFILKHIEEKICPSKLLRLVLSSISLYTLGFMWYYLYQEDINILGNLCSNKIKDL